MADIVIINPRFEVSFWGMEHALPFVGKRANLPVACLPLLAALTPPEHTVTLIDENVEPIDCDRCAAGRHRRRHRNERPALPHAGDPHGAQESRRASRSSADRWVTVRKTISAAWPTSIFVGEAEETWPQFLARVVAAGSISIATSSPKRPT